MRSVALSEVKDRLSEFVAAAESGDEIVITRHGKARARLVAVNDEDERRRRVAAAWDALRMQRDKMRADNRTATMAELIDWKNAGRP